MLSHFMQFPTLDAKAPFRWREELGTKNTWRRKNQINNIITPCFWIDRKKHRKNLNKLKIQCRRNFLPSVLKL